MFQRIEKLIDPFGPFSDTEMPPTTVSRFTWHYLRPIAGWLVVLLAISVVTGALESSLYLLIGWFVDLLAHSKPETILREHGVALLAAALLVLVVRPLLQTIDETVQNQIIVPQSTTMIRWRTHLYTLRHSVGYFQGDFAGRLANRITQTGPAVREIAVTLLDTLVYVAIFAATAIGLFASISIRLAIPMVLWIAAYIGLMWYFVPRAQARSLANSEGRSLLVGRIVDSYTNILTVKLFARTDDERSSVRGALESWMGSFLDLMRLITGVTSALVVMNALLLTATAALSLDLWMAGRMSTGEIAAGLALAMRVVTMSGWVMHTVRGIFENIGVIQESMSTIARPHAVTDKPGARDLVVTKGEILFDDVTFNYGRPPSGPAASGPGDSRREDGVIEHLKLTIGAGEKVGIVGPSGAGKTTLTTLLLRLHDLEGGRLLIDGQDVAGVTQDSLRRQIAVVTQDTSLLHRSIGDNIGYGRGGATEADIRRAAELAHAMGFISDLEDHKGRRGFEAHVGERGVKLSGGQRQRIAIARVILKDAPILVMDEATSALDSEIEAAIQDSLSSLMAGKTVLAIAHRLSTIAALDRLIVMDRGRIVETGTHAELLAKAGLYARLWERQSGGFLGKDGIAEAAE